MKKGKFLRAIFGLLIATLIMGLGSGTALAAKRKSTWYKTKAGSVYYYDENGKKLKDGRYKIKGKYYYFDEKGRQRTGWQQIGDDYYYFKIGRKSRGYMLKSTTVNGIKLKKSGKAKMTNYARQKLPVLYAANVKMRSLTKCGDTKSQRLRKCWDSMIKSFQSSSGGWIKLYNLGAFSTRNGKWDIYYGTKIFVDGDVKADCNACGVVFAYLANACGYEATCVASGGHGWCEIKGKVYDPDWAAVMNSDLYYGLPRTTTGANIPAYASSGIYRITI